MDEKAARIMREQWFCVIATASAEGVPWVTPVFYNFDPAYRLIWESSREAQHSKLIAANPNVAIVVANFETRNADEAVYLVCRAREVPPDGLDEALDVFLHGAHERKETVPRTSALYLDDQPLRLYEAVPEKAYLLVVSHDPDGRRIDHRQETQLR
ncbi:MAG: pyridoxamine 5'-phosphate oxidase family protein [Dehalococcoidia bacterium]